MNTTNDDYLKTAAQEGDINLLYSVIQDDPSVLERVDLIPFVETPLHIAASKGHLQFATEVMMLKPSFAWKLNQQGFSPIHLAMQNNQKRMVLRFVKINKYLVKVKGREGETPLHLASKKGEIELLANFLFACPESIEDVNVRCETTLHIAVKNEQYEALQYLVDWLHTNIERGARELEYKILNWQDEAGNTILHVSAQNKQSQILAANKNYNVVHELAQALRVLLKTGIKLKAKNLENATALDIAPHGEIESILSGAGAKLVPKVLDISEMSILYLLRFRSDISDKQRNALLVVVTLVITATYQSALTPPGGVYQISAGDNNVNTTSLNSTTTVGKSILSKEDFYIFSLFNTLSLMASIMAIGFLTPGRSVGVLSIGPVGCFILCYVFSMQKVSPTSFDSIITQIIVYYYLFGVVCWIIILVYYKYKAERFAKNWEIKTRTTRGNKNYDSLQLISTAGPAFSTNVGRRENERNYLE